MQTAEVICTDGYQAVKLPEEFRFTGNAVSIRREGEAVILEPLKPAAWSAVDAIYQRLAASGRTFSDSADLLREDRDR